MEIKDIIRLILIQAGAVAFLILGLRVLFVQHLNSAFRRLKKLQEEALIKEENLKEELERAKQERIAEVERGKQEAKALIERAKKDAEVLRSKMEERAKEDCQKTIMYGKEEVDKLKEKLLSDIEKRSVKVAIEMIKCIFTDKGRENFQHQLVEELIDEINNLQKDIFSVRADKVKLITTFPLNKEEKERLKKMLSHKVGADIDLVEELNEELISGLIVKIGEFVIDGSIANKIQKVIPYIKVK